jgi:hypothetical protein
MLFFFVLIWQVASCTLFIFSKANNKASLVLSASLCASLIHGVSAKLLILTPYFLLVYSFLFFLKFQKQWRFWIEINNCSSQSIGIETSKVFGTSVFVFSK